MLKMNCAAFVSKSYFEFGCSCFSVVVHCVKLWRNLLTLEFCYSMNVGTLIDPFRAHSTYK